MTWLPWAIAGALGVLVAGLLVHAIRSSGRAGERRGGDAEKLEAARRGEEAQDAESKAIDVARGGLGRRVRRRMRELGKL